jgi:hypothetical protein
LPDRSVTFNHTRQTIEGVDLGNPGLPSSDIDTRSPARNPVAIGHPVGPGTAVIATPFIFLPRGHSR